MAQAQAQHPDGTRRGISYSLFSGNRKQAFTIVSSTGETQSFLNMMSDRMRLQNVNETWFFIKHMSLICNLMIS